MGDVRYHLVRTISLWCAVGGTIALMTGRKKTAITLWRICGLGGMGAVYGAYAAEKQLPVQPWPVARELAKDPKRRAPLVSAGWHGAFLVGAEVLDKRH